MLTSNVKLGIIQTSHSSEFSQGIGKSSEVAGTWQPALKHSQLPENICSLYFGPKWIYIFETEIFDKMYPIEKMVLSHRWCKSGWESSENLGERVCKQLQAQTLFILFPVVIIQIRPCFHISEKGGQKAEYYCWIFMQMWERFTFCLLFVIGNSGTFLCTWFKYI